MYCQGSAQGYPCLENDYNRMNDIFKKELALKISVDDIVNQSNFCTSIAIDIVKELEADKDFLNLNKYLKGLSGKMGIYHLWVDADVFCQDHEKYLMACAYVGKGYAESRVLSHIKDKWPDTQKIYIFL